MLGNRKVQCNGSAHDDVQQSMGRLTIHDNGGNSTVGDETLLLPVRPGEPDCTYFLRTGTCGYGRNCRYNHPSDAGQEYGVRNSFELPERDGALNCGFYLKTGTCKFGSTCKYNHPKDGRVDVLMNALGLPMRQDAQPCPYYMRNGTCRYGSSCKFHHPQPVSAPNFLPLLGTPAPLSTPTYFPHSLFQPPQSYMPFYAYPSQGWGTYMGSVCPFSASSFVTAPTSQLSVYCLPEQPNMPQCRQFMNYGTCNYGSGCIYHHPREKILLLASRSIGSLGLTLGPAVVSSPSSRISPAKPLKLSGSAAGRKTEPLDMAKVGDSPDRSDSFPHSSGASSEANNNTESD